jgi:hypothetical protein
MNNPLIHALIDLVGIVTLAAGVGAAVGLLFRRLRRKRRDEQNQD